MPNPSLEPSASTPSDPQHASETASTRHHITLPALLSDEMERFADKRGLSVSFLFRAGIKLVLLAMKLEDSSDRITDPGAPEDGLYIKRKGKFERITLMH